MTDTPSTGWHLDETGALNEGTARPHPHGYTWQEFSAQNRPPCPTCGSRIDIDPVPSTNRATGETIYTPGRWTCPNGCQ